MAQRAIGLPPAALARWTDVVDRRRQLARALHGGPAPRARRITERLDELRHQLAEYRRIALAIHKKLIELEAGGYAEAGALRLRLMEISVRIEVIVRTLVDP